ncbi:hypothetical protein P3S68_011831 [Capsicum galapagoense]
MIDARRPRLKIKLPKEASSNVKAPTHHKSLDHSRFAYTIKEYNISQRYLYLPQHFAYANGLTNKKCDLIIRDDERKRSWNLRPCSCETRTLIGGGWPKFISDNLLKKGDHIMFEVVTNGETPIWKFQVVTNQETPFQNFQAKFSHLPASYFILFLDLFSFSYMCIIPRYVYNGACIPD